MPWMIEPAEGRVGPAMIVVCNDDACIAETERNASEAGECAMYLCPHSSVTGVALSQREAADA